MKGSLWLQWALLAQYIVIMGFSLWEKNWGKALYWLGAVILLLGVNLGMK